MKEGIHFTKPLLSNNRGIYIEKHDCWEAFMKYAAEMGSGAMMYIPSFIKIGSGILTLMGGGDSETDSMEIA
jgi:hypothetical protein